MLNSLSRNRTLPQIVPRCGCVDPLPGRLPYQGYESPCSGRHYCLRGMDYCTTGEPSTERRLRPLCSQQPTVRFAGIRPPCPGSTLKRAPPPRVPPCSAVVTQRTLPHSSPVVSMPGPHRLLSGPPGHKRTAKAENQHEGYSQVLNPVLSNRAQGQPVKCLYSGDPAKNNFRGFQTPHISRILSLHSCTGPLGRETKVLVFSMFSLPGPRRTISSSWHDHRWGQGSGYCFPTASLALPQRPWLP